MREAFAEYSACRAPTCVSKAADSAPTSRGESANAKAPRGADGGAEKGTCALSGCARSASAGTGPGGGGGGPAAGGTDAPARRDVPMRLAVNPDHCFTTCDTRAAEDGDIAPAATGVGLIEVASEGTGDDAADELAPEEAERRLMRPFHLFTTERCKPSSFGLASLGAAAAE